MKIFFIFLLVFIFASCLSFYLDWNQYFKLFLSTKILDIKTLQDFASTNLGVVASLMGFLIATMPFLISVIQNDEDLIRETEDLDEIIKSLYFLFMIFILSLSIFLFNLKCVYIRIIIVATYISLYLAFFVYFYKIILILSVLSKHLKELLNKKGGKSK